LALLIQLVFKVVSLELAYSELPIPILEVVSRTGAVPSKKEAKRLVEGIFCLVFSFVLVVVKSSSGGGLIWAGTTVVDPHHKAAVTDFKDGLCVLRVGKKRAFVVRLKLPV
jgi:tyrosyl-tRNA synthetase